MSIAKALVAIVVSAAGALVTALGTGGDSLSSLDTKHWLMALAAVLGSGGLVWFTENGAWHPYIKAVVAFLSAGVASLIVALNNSPHITTSAWLTAFIAAVTATGLVFQIPNKGQTA